MPEQTQPKEMTSDSARVHSLDLLRSAAILAVVFYHCPFLPSGFFLKTLAGWGALGVDLFFVLSGFLIASQWFRALQLGTGSSLARFYIRRGFRIWPNYFAMILLFVSFPAATGETLVPLWKYLLLVQNFSHPINFGVSWSLCIEEHFYLIFPLLAVWLFRKGAQKTVLAVFGAVFLGGIFLRLGLWLHHRPDKLWLTDKARAESLYYLRFYLPTYSRLDGLTLGVGLAAIKRFRPDTWMRLMRRGDLLVASGLLVAFLCILMGSRTLGSHLPEVLLTANGPSSSGLVPMVFGSFGWALSFTLLMAGGLSPSSLLSRIRLPGTGRVAILSYSGYLVHMEAFKVCTALTQNLGLPLVSWTSTAIGLLLVFLLSNVLYWTVERPFLSLRDRYFSG